LLKAISILKSQGVFVNVVLSGKKTPYFETLKRMVCDLHLDDLVVSLGYLTDAEIRGLYSLASVLTYPSLYEGFCLPVAEAMAAGVPCVVSNRACLPEIAGEAAMIIDPDRPEEFAGSIHGILEDQEVRESLIARGRERAAGYSWSDTARKTLELYRDVAGA
jgi:glycosyltransferase involved in cell wall biosynthesis